MISEIEFKRLNDMQKGGRAVDRPTLKDVAQRAGGTSATVSYALSGKRPISEETKRRVMEAIQELDYVPDLNARSLSMRDSKLIGVVVPQTEPGERLMFQNSFYSEVLGSIEYYARQQGYRFVQVKTVAAGHYSEYDATRTAYEHMGFVALEVFPTLWDENNPCLIMVKAL